MNRSRVLVLGGLLTAAFMGVINLAHGSFYMVGAYLAYWLAKLTGNLWLAIPIGSVITLGIGGLLETMIINRLYQRDHLYQVLITFGLILIFEELRSMLFGNDVHGEKRSNEQIGASKQGKRLVICCFETQCKN